MLDSIKCALENPLKNISGHESGTTYEILFLLRRRGLKIKCGESFVVRLKQKMSNNITVFLDCQRKNLVIFTRVTVSGQVEMYLQVELECSMA